MSPVDRESIRLVRKGAWVGALGNLFIGAFKLFIGISLNSIAVIADAIHSFEDLLSSVTILIGYRWVAKPADREHPFGHGRAQEITGLVMALLLLWIAFQIGLSSVKRILHPSPMSFSIVIPLLLLLTALLKEVMARYAKRLAQKARSMALMADVTHHRVDAFSSLLIVAGLFGIKFGAFILDGVLGLVLAGVIVWLSVTLMKEVSSALLGEAPSGELLSTIEKIVGEVGEAQYVHRLRVHQYGSHNEVTLHLQLDPGITLLEAHRIATRIENLIRERIGGEITIHVEPKGDEFEKAP